jgi:cytochrome P450
VVKRQQNKDVNSKLDALDILLAYQDEKGNSLTLEEIKEQLLNLLFAGYSSMASALSSFCLLMAQHSDTFIKIREEQKLLDQQRLTLEKLKKMPYLEQVIKEVLRLLPPVGGGFRKCIEKCTFKGLTIEKGWNVIYQIPLTHQNPEIYTAPQQFDPDRFAEGKAEDKKLPFGYLPFGGGIRECIGKEFARLELKIFTALLVREFNWELLPTQNLQMVSTPFPRPVDDLKVHFYKIC